MNVLSIILSIVLVIASLAVMQGGSALSSITKNFNQSSYISVYVMDESSYQTVSDLKGQVIEASTNDDYMADAMEALKSEESTIEVKNVDDYYQLADTYDEVHEDFETETRIIYTYEYKTADDDIAKSVNVTTTPFNIYISGIDTSGKVSNVSRSDVNMIVTVNPKTKTILMTSIPRDYYVTLANKGKKDKLTHAGLGGVSNSVATLENFLGIDINYYVRVNFTSLITMVDALGGIDVYSDKAFTPHTNKSIIIYEGTNHMNGEMALAFSRERYAYSNGDSHRVKNQQAVLQAMLVKMMSPAQLINYPSIMNSISGTFETNMSSSDITDLIKMQLSDMASCQMTGTDTTMTGGAYMPNNNLYYMIPNDDSVRDCVNKINKVMNGESLL